MTRATLVTLSLLRQISYVLRPSCICAVINLPQCVSTYRVVTSGRRACVRAQRMRWTPPGSQTAWDHSRVAGRPQYGSVSLAPWQCGPRTRPCAALGSWCRQDPMLETVPPLQITIINAINYINKSVTLACRSCGITVWIFFKQGYVRSWMKLFVVG